MRTHQAYSSSERQLRRALRGTVCQPTWWPRTLRKRSFPDNSRKYTVRIPGTVSQKSTIWHIWHIWQLEGPAHRAVGMRLIIFTFVTVRKQLWGLLICRYLEVLSYAHFQRRPQKERREDGEPLSAKRSLANKPQCGP